MKHDHINISYTAADIRQYLEGKMPPRQMNALEKAALEDPFLQEAIEGYDAVAAEDWQPVLQGLQKGFSAPAAPANNTAKVVGMGRKRFGWIKYAAAVLILGGGFATIYRINQNQPNSQSTAPVATAEKSNAPALNDAVPPAVADTAKTLAIDKSTATNTTFANTTTENTPVTGNVTFKNEIKKASDSVGYAVNDVNPGPMKEQQLMELKTETVVPTEPAEKKQYAPLSPLPPMPVAKPAAKLVQPVAASPKSGYEYDMKDVANAAEREKLRNNEDVASKQKARFFNQQTLNTGQGLLGNNINKKEVNRSFVAQVVDDNNNPLPFANINVKNEAFGTYADAKGNVRLVSTDSVIPIEVKSLGFQSQSITLRSTAQPTTIRLNEDRNIAYQEKTVERKQSTNNIMSRRAYLQRDAAQNAEPADGWDKYDTYISNNLVIPDDLVKKNLHGEVELSFDVQQNGTISNIKVDKSLCSDCDEIAKRIVAQGPQWKVKKGKKAKARVTVQF